MANNRIFIKCKVCDSRLEIGKHFGGAYFPPENLTTELEKFFEEHAFCQTNMDGFADRGDFEIEYEIEPVKIKTKRGESNG